MLTRCATSPAPQGGEDVNQRMYRGRTLALQGAAWAAAIVGGVALAFVLLSLVAEWQTWRYLSSLDGTVIQSPAGKVGITGVTVVPGVLDLRAQLRAEVCTVLGCDAPALIALRARNNPWLPIAQRIGVVGVSGATSWRTLVDLQGVAPGLFAHGMTGR